MVTTGRLDHASACSLNPRCRCCGLGVVLWMLNCETVICDMLTKMSTPTSRATAAVIMVALSCVSPQPRSRFHPQASALDPTGSHKAFRDADRCPAGRPRGVPVRAVGSLEGAGAGI